MLHCFDTDHGPDTDHALLFPERVADIVYRYPDKPALHVGNITYTYRQLWDVSTQIAIMLTDVPGDFCALVAVKSFYSYAAILGIMRSGKCYLPISAEEPANRISKLLRDADCQVILTESEGEHFDDCIGLCVSTLIIPEAISSIDLSGADKLPKLQSIQASSLLFTSGSTGVPKGVITQHQAYAAYLDSASNIFHPCPQDRVSQLAPLTFDFSLHEIGLAWCSGACLYAIDRLDSYNMAQAICKWQISFWSSVPSAWLLLERLGGLQAGKFPSLRVVITGGECMPVALIEKCRAACPNATFFNIYGPTEAAIAMTISSWHEQYLALGEFPLGHLLPGNRLLLVDEQMNAVSDGETGEILLSGIQVAEGYWDQPSSERFVELSGETGLWYRTGDYGVWQRETGLHFRGRQDAQWQVRGYRVEQTEVEKLMCRVAQTPYVAVLARTNEHNLVCALVAFIESSPYTISQIRQRCRQFMPDYMFPQHIFCIELPKNHNLKTDYLALKVKMEQLLEITPIQNEIKKVQKR
ncbi:AMP-binding protein [Vibrio ruber]|uniref:AMP-binding protein n=1 Tax=Vibrio ruber TaxID=184755 RepID=UPI0028930A94|nr:AMP-binding protein [Vibrio ruber]WNJ94731.1 AMP-binding protein [Vibrio ruber]